ncbi:uncharacterized protein A4U43_C10F11710 [Asparagus officinalis]|uniref:Uncharacterized protein n=1 Tax=Asparagus officinalis TaxID=4686 RepID=A0A5P1E246_ASPOF|nr:uncharacterized protein A4U43_C10F11710 [Asparagus officinalis]
MILRLIPIQPPTVRPSVMMDSSARSEERHEEVDHLLDKTRLEMHATVQSGDCSPKPLNGSTSTQQLKSDTESLQNSSSSFPAQVKKKKRERGVIREQNLLSEKVLLSWRMVNLPVLDSTIWQKLRL